MDGGSSRYDYEAKEFDSVTNTYDFHFRGYKADWGLFTQPDTLLPNVYDPQQLNRYAFERGNPWKNTDEDGHNILKFIQPYVVPALRWIATFVTEQIFQAGFTYLDRKLGEFIDKIKEKDEKEDDPIVLVIKVDKRDPNVEVVTYLQVKQSELDDVTESLSRDGWHHIPSGGSSGGYYCIGVGCPSDDDGGDNGNSGDDGDNNNGNNGNNNNQDDDE